MSIPAEIATDILLDRHHYWLCGLDQSPQLSGMLDDNSKEDLMNKLPGDCKFLEREQHPRAEEVVKKCKEKTEEGSVERTFTDQPLQVYFCTNWQRKRKMKNNGCPYCSTSPRTWDECDFYQSV